MGWKSSGSRSWTRVSKWPGVGRTQRWPFSKSDADAYYDEGDITTHISNPVWRTKPVGPTDREEHNPCGYWQGEAPRYYTTLLYPLEVLDKVEGIGDFLEGELRYVFIFYTIPIESLSGEFDFTWAEFRSTFRYYDWAESLEGEHEFISAEFKQIMRSYDIGIESLEGEPDLYWGKHNEVIQYQNWPVEELECATMDLVSGEFYV